jgi:hypothetical protein
VNVVEQSGSVHGMFDGRVLEELEVDRECPFLGPGLDDIVAAPNDRTERFPIEDAIELLEACFEDRLQPVLVES